MHAVKDIFKVENSGRVSVLMLVKSPWNLLPGKQLVKLLCHHGICCQGSRTGMCTGSGKLFTNKMPEG